MNCDCPCHTVIQPGLVPCPSCDRLLLRFESLDPLAQAVNPPADRPDLVEDGGLGRADPVPDLVGEDLEASMLGVQVRGDAGAELSEHRAEVIFGHLLTMPELQPWESASATDPDHSSR